jgi:hypothetical protein
MELHQEPIEGDTLAFDKPRTAFGPQALSRFTQILEEVTLDLVGDGVPVEQVRAAEMRRRLAQRLLGFAGSWWTDTQIKQLLLRALRNEISASRRTRPAKL